MQNDDGIIKNANDAKEKTEVKDLEERIKIAISQVEKENHNPTIEEIIDNLIKEDIIEDESKVNKETGAIETKDPQYIFEGLLDDYIKTTLVPGEIASTTKKDNYTDRNKDTATIPEGFKVSDKSQEEGRNLTQINTGLVVIGADGSEFVWIPVSNINNMVMCKEHYKDTENPECNIELKEDTLICTKHNNSEDICGKLYAENTGNNTFNSTLKEQTYQKNVKLREPDLITDSGYDNSNSDKVTLDLLNQEFKEMAISVAKYGGFYVSRYEMGLTAENKPTSKNASKSENNVTTVNNSNTSTSGWYGLYKKAKEYNTNENVDKKIKSNMIWGSQYDAIMRWMHYNGIKVKETFEEEKNKTEITGKEEKDILNNIYDLSGCHYEWTIESCETTGRVLRRRTYALQLVSK